MSAERSEDAPGVAVPIVTAHDVARLAGVSQSAVSRAFTPGASISARMRARVTQAADQLGYRPNVLARSLSTGRSRIVGIVMGNVENPFFPLALDQMSLLLSEHGYRLLLFTGEVNVRADHQVEELLRYRVDAIILLSAMLSSKLAGECRKAGIPVILFNRTSARSQHAFSVTGDNAGGGRAIARHLVERGYRRPAYLAGYPDSSTSQAREAAFAQALAEAGRAQPLRAEGGFTQAGAAQAMRALLQAPERPDAVFCANDHMALVALQVARHEFALEPGRDIGIVGFDDIPMAGWPSFALTTYSQPVEAMAREAVGFVAALGQADAPRHVVVPGQLVVRASTR